MKPVPLFAAIVVAMVTIACLAEYKGSVAPPGAGRRTAILAAESPDKAPAEPTTAPAAAPVTPIAAATPADAGPPVVRVERSGEVRYVARAGDTVSQLAVALLGTDTKAHRDAVIAANPSLQADPDRVLELQAYTVAAPATVAPAAPKVIVPPPVAATPAPVVPVLKYTARTGDTVGALAAGLLGADTQANRAAIVAGNVSLRQDPDRLVAGQSYTIVARHGLIADPKPVPAPVPAELRDPEDAVVPSGGRTLTYTARPGDTVSSLAKALLGGDTAAHRDAIISANPSLSDDADLLTAGHTYRIAAPERPTAE